MAAPTGACECAKRESLHKKGKTFQHPMSPPEDSPHTPYRNTQEVQTLEGCPLEYQTATPPPSSSEEHDIKVQREICGCI